MDSSSWLRFAIFALILISFLRRIAKVKAQRKVPSQASPGRAGATLQGKFPSTITPTMARPRSGRKNDFRDIPPPPENPDLG